jgi:tetratricopeptide (TPR) repeat protein
MKLRSTFLACVAAALPIVPAAGQDGFGGREVVQPLPPPAAEELKEALGRLARNPKSLDALIAAGTASLELDDVDAAVGFFGRAAELAPDDPRIKAGKAAAYVRTKRPDEALRLFQEAEAAGVEIVKLAGDYGLAWDLVGNNREAQMRYQRALAAGAASDEVSRRLALSYAIDGNGPAFEATLRPLLEKRDFPAYRTRAFGLAILGKPDDAVAITEAVMDRPMATKLEPYLRFMPQLTRAQQAAAANLGIYPTASRIGRDDPRIAAMSGGAVAGPSGAKQVAAADSALAPTGAPFAPAAPTVTAAETAPSGIVAGVIADSRDDAERQVRVARREASSDPLARTAERPRIVERPRETAETKPPASVQQSATTPPVVAVAEAQPVAQSAAGAVDTRLPEVLAGTELGPTATVPAVSQGAPVVVARMESSTAGPSFDLGRIDGSSTGQPSVVAASVPTAAPASAAPSLASVADAFADLAVPPIVVAKTPAAGAVDITAIKAPREVEKREVEKREAEAKAALKPTAKSPPPKPVAPSRFWIQVATGQDKSALKFDWRRLTKQADGMLDGKGPFVTAWGQTNRLLAGPYKTRDEARKALKELQEKGLDAFTFTSPEGQEVAELR